MIDVDAGKSRGFTKNRLQMYIRLTSASALASPDNCHTTAKVLFFSFVHLKHGSRYSIELSSSVQPYLLPDHDSYYAARCLLLAWNKVSLVTWIHLCTG